MLLGASCQRFGENKVHRGARMVERLLGACVKALRNIAALRLTKLP